MSTADAAPQKRLVICLDGTWNNPANEKPGRDGGLVYKPTNVLKTSRAVLDTDATLATLTLQENPNTGDTLSIDGKLYTFETNLTPGDGHVHIDQDGPADTLENLLFAINKRRHRGRYDNATTQHPSIEAQPIPLEPDRIFLTPRPEPGSPPYQGISHTVEGLAVTQRSPSGHRHDARASVTQITYYDIGVGATRKYPGFSNTVHRRADKFLGGAAGAGFEANVEDAATFLSLNYQPGDEIFVFGFSRGAASARSLVRYIDWMGGLLPSRDNYWTPTYFDAFLRGSATSGAELRAQLLNERIGEGVRNNKTPEQAKLDAERKIGTIMPVRIRFLGVWDTVLAIGAQRAKAHVGISPPSIVDIARQALAIDERRSNFIPRIWQRPANDQQDLQQRWFSGVHTDVGGGYPTDGLANVPLRWMLGEAQRAGLGLDWDFLSFYRPNPVGCQHNSYTTKWKVVDTLTFKRKKGVRKITTDRQAGLEIHPSALKRLATERVQHCDRQGQTVERPYGPKNLATYLASLPNLDRFLEKTGLEPANRSAIILKARNR